VLDRVGDAWLSVKHAVLSVFGRGPGNATALEQAGTAGGAALGGGVAVKAVTACLAMGGGAAICIEQGLFDGKPDEPSRAERAQSSVTGSSPRPERATFVPARAREKPKPQTPRRQQRQRTRPPTSSPTASPDPSPAPTGSTEFGAGTIGSSSAPTRPAAAPPDGGGEFGP
jgi:hypothetical protein